MADVNRGNRPLSPHLSIYAPQWTWIPSITHRVTGCAQALGALAIVFWFLGAASGPLMFARVDGLLTSWIGVLVMIGSLWAFCYHLANGVRHLFWDAGYGFEVGLAEKTAKAVVAGSIALTLLFLLFA